MKILAWSVGVLCLMAVVVAGAVWEYAGLYGLDVLVRHGGTYWIPVRADSRLLSPAMRRALRSSPPASPGLMQWRSIAQGFDVADLPVVAEGSAVDHVLLARIEPDRFRFVVRNSSAGDKGLDQWMTQLNAILVVNGSYFAQDGNPDTPFLSDGLLLGPKDYDAKAGAFVAAPTFTGIRNLAEQSWQMAFRNAHDAMVSYPLLLDGGASHVRKESRWLANRSFVGQDQAGRIVIGTTTDAFFSLDRLARFLLDAPLDLALALNLDGGPVACQGISLNGYGRKTYGRWEAQVEGDRVSLLVWPFGTVAMPVVLAVLPNQS